MRYEGWVWHFSLQQKMPLYIIPLERCERRSLVKIINKTFVLKGLFEILQFYSTSGHYPQTSPSILKLEG